MENSYKQFEEERNRLKRKNRVKLPLLFIGSFILTFIVIGIVMPRYFISFGSGMLSIKELATSLVVAVGVVYIESGKDKHKFAVAYKESIYKSLMEKDDKLSLSLRGISKDDIRELKLIAFGDTYRSYDLVGIQENNVSAKFSNVHNTQSYTDSDGKRKTRVVFDGVYFLIKYPRKFNGQHLIIEKTNPLFNTSGKLRVADKEFMDKFKIQSSDEQELFYILKPEIIETIKKLERKYHGDFRICFNSNELHIAIRGAKRKIDISIKSNLDESDLQEVYEEIDVLKEFISEFELDSYKFNKTSLEGK